MSHEISRRYLIGGAAALAGAGALGGPTKSDIAAFSTNGGTQNRFFAGFINEHWLYLKSPNWRWLVSDDGLDSISLWRPNTGKWASVDELVHGSRVMTLRPRQAEGDNLHSIVRILHTFAPNSWEAMSDRKLAQDVAQIKSTWVTARVIAPRRNGCPSLVLCHLRDKNGFTRVHRLHPVGVLQDAKRGDSVEVKIGKTWEGWQVFEARRLPGRARNA